MWPKKLRNSERITLDEHKTLCFSGVTTGEQVPVIIKHNRSGRLLSAKDYPHFSWVDKPEHATLWHKPHIASSVIGKFKLNAQLEHVAIGAKA
jgi:hypothetical protein